MKKNRAFTMHDRVRLYRKNKRRLISKQKAKVNRIRGRVGQPLLRQRGFKTKKDKGWTVIPAPREFRILTKAGREGINQFLKEIDISARNPDAKIYLDFTHTVKMYADATLLFLARMQQIFTNSRAIVIHCKRALSPKINEVLTQIRLLKMLGQDFHIMPHREDVIHWKLAVGKGADGQKYESVLGHYDGTLSTQLLKGFYLGVTEAMTNTRQHAYPDRNVRQDDHPEWWMFSQEKDNWLTVTFCDLGVGIPETLPIKKPDIFKMVQSIYKGNETDAQIIEGAIKYRKTRTGKKFRGKGLSQLNKVIENAENGSGFFIYSGKGCYSRFGDAVRLHDFPTSIGGTVITWRVPI